MLDKNVRNKGTIPMFDANVTIMSNAECFLFLYNPVNSIMCSVVLAVD